jgi:hypothetical protein
VGRGFGSVVSPGMSRLRDLPVLPRKRKYEAASETSAAGQKPPPAPQKAFVGDALCHLPGTPPIGVDFSKSCQWDVPKFQREGSNDAIGRREQSVTLYT